jgi:hypothetical protein
MILIVGISIYLLFFSEIHINITSKLSPEQIRMKKTTFKDMVTVGDWKPRKTKKNKVKVRGRFIFGGYPLGIVPGTGGLPDGDGDAGGAMGEAVEGDQDLELSADDLPGDDTTPTDEIPATGDDTTSPPEEEKEEDPNKQGVIRTVKGAHLVYKRTTPDGRFEELWIYNITPAKAKGEMKIKQAILAGTDIPLGKQSSEDGESSYEMVTLGNATMVKITGLVQ